MKYFIATLVICLLPAHAFSTPLAPTSIPETSLPAPIQPGKRLRNFELENAFEQMLSLQHMLDYGPLVISFYQGGWSSHSNIQLQNLQKSLEKINRMGVNLVAISPELTQHARKTIMHNKLNFNLLHDKDLKLARSLDIVSMPKGPDQLKFRHDFKKAQGSYLSEFYGASSDEMSIPMPITLIVDEEATIYATHIPDSPRTPITEEYLMHTLTKMRNERHINQPTQQ